MGNSVAPSDEAFQQMALSVEHVDEAIALTRHVIVLGSILFSISDE
jgi:hypothetical protein